MRSIFYSKFYFWIKKQSVLIIIHTDWTFLLDNLIVDSLKFHTGTKKCMAKALFLNKPTQIKIYYVIKTKLDWCFRE